MNVAKKLIQGILTMVICSGMMIPVGITRAAGGLSALSDTLSRLTENTNSNHTIAFTTTAGVGAGKTMTVTFPSGFTMGAGIDYTDVDVADDGSDLTLDATPSGTTWGAAFGGTGNRTLTITSATGTIDAGSDIVIEVGTNATQGATGDKQVQNGAAGDYVVEVTAGDSESGTIGILTITNDQIVVDASVDPTLAFTISSNAITFGSLSSTTVRYATTGGSGSDTEPGAGQPVQLEVGTNAASGFTVAVRSKGSGNGSEGNGSAGLYSAGLANLIAATGPSSVSVGSEGYAVYGKNPSNSGEFDAVAGFKSDGTTALTTSYQTFANGATPTTINRTLDLVLMAGISASTKSGKYADTLTLVCTANF